MMTWQPSRRQFLLMLPAGMLAAPGAARAAAAQPATPAASAPPNDLLVANAVGPDGALLHKNFVVSAPDGSQQRTVTSDEILALYPAPDAKQALVATIHSAVFVLDPVQARLLPAISPHWALLGSTHGLASYLVNLLTGTADTLPALTAQDLGNRLAAIAPDEQHVLLAAGGALWLVSTAHPDQRRPLVQHALIGQASFADDGQRVVYSATGLQAGPWSLGVANSDGTHQTVVATNQGGVAGAFVPGSHGQQLIVQRPGAIVRLSLANHQERTLANIDAQEIPAGVWFSPSGQRLIVRTVTPQSSASGNRWTWLDLASGHVTRLTTLNDLLVLELGTPRRWVLASNVLANNPDNQGAPIYSVDTETGTVRLLFKAAAKTRYFGNSPANPPTADGRSRVILALETEKPEEHLLLIDAEAGMVRTVASGEIVAGVFSPDGHWLAVNIVPAPGPKVNVTTQLIATGGTATQPFRGGFVEGWLASGNAP